MGMATGCSPILECDFLECMEDEIWEGHDSCWREDCHSECGEYTCALWHYEYETEDWLIDPCEEEANWEMQAMKAGSIVAGFEGTFATAFNVWCDEGHCIEGAGDEVVREVG